MHPQHLTPLSTQEIESLTNTRNGEVKLGQVVSRHHSQPIRPGDFVVLGIPEDIGVRANYGKPGTSGFWLNFLARFLNLQSNGLLPANRIKLLGAVNCTDLMETAARTNSIENLRELTIQVDNRVQPVVEYILGLGGTPIVIGGGHNNCLPLIRALAAQSQKAIQVVNLDAHADLRALDGRHSGNGFSYALEENLLERYLPIALQAAHTNEYMLSRIQKDQRIHAHWYSAQIPTPLLIDKAFQSLKATSPLGVELDLDVVSNFPSSAQAPTGVSIADARYFVQRAALIEYTQKYLHLCEAMPATEPVNAPLLVAYLVWDFIAASNTN